MGWHNVISYYCLLEKNIDYSTYFMHKLSNLKQI